MNYTQTKDLCVSGTWVKTLKTIQLKNTLNGDYIREQYEGMSDFKVKDISQYLIN